MPFVFDHVHLSAPSQAAACRWYIDHLGARPATAPDRVLVADERWLIFYEAPRAIPSGESVIHAIGFSVANVGEKAADLVEAGAALIRPMHDAHGLPTLVVADPFGAQIALIDDPDARGFHDVRLRMPRPDEGFAWYAHVFGCERARFRGAFDALRSGDVWLFGDAGIGQPSLGHAIDHIAWRAPHLDTAAAELKAQGVAFTMEPRQFNERVRISFVTGPAETRIEVLERTAPSG